MADGTRPIAERKAARARQPVTRHPLFPAIVGLWFCALFGLSSLAIRVTVLENAVVASGIDLIVPAAAPPLGMTARILLALMLGVIGALIGYALGTRIGRGRPQALQRRRTQLSAQEPPLPRRADRFSQAASPPPRPLSAFEELDDHGARIDMAEPAIAGIQSGPARRRSLALAEPTGPDYARSSAPLPGGENVPMAACFDNDESDVLELADALPEETIEEALVPDDNAIVPTAGDHASSEPFEFASSSDLSKLEAVAAPVPRRFDQGAPSRRFTQPGTSSFSSATSASDEMPVPRLMAADPIAAADEVEEDDRGLPPRNLGLRFGAPQATVSEASVLPTSALAPAAAASTPPTESRPIQFAVPAATGSAAERLRSTPLESLSQLELIERLALSMQQRRAAAEAAAAMPAPVEPQAPRPAAGLQADALPRFGFEPRMPLELDEPPATFMPPAAPAASPLPAALRPIGFDADAEDDAAEHVVPRFAFARPVIDASTAPAVPAVPSAYEAPLDDVAAVTDDLDELDEATVEGESFSSLLGLGRAPQRQPLIRIEEPVDEEASIEPVVVFPGHSSRPFAAPAPAPVVAPDVELPAASQPGMRRFDAPADRPPATATAAAPRQDPEETERALRAALATLQRMSGAA